jgi:peptide/nickel transport system substrate-binding protein
MRRFLSGTALVLCISGCDGGAPPEPANEYGGTLVISTGADINGLMPPLIYTVQENSVVDIIFERLAEPGMDLNSVGDLGFTPELAQSWEWSEDSLSIAFSMLPNAHFHDGQPVTAHDVAFTYDVYTDPRTGSGEAELLAHIDSVTARDSATAVFWFARRYPQQFFDATYHMRILPRHLLSGVARGELRTAEFARQPVGSGQFRFVRHQPGAMFEVAADTTHARGRPYLDNIVWTVTSDLSAAMTRLLARDADFLEMVPAGKFSDVAAQPELALARYPSLGVGFLQFNLQDPRSPASPHPIFGNREVRRAIAMSLDRKKLVSAVFDSLAIVAQGPFASVLATADSSVRQIEFDPARAQEILDSLGWRDRNEDGVRERNGRPLSFTLVSPTSSVYRTRMAILIEDMLSDVGIRVVLQTMDINPFMQFGNSRAFDAIFSSSYYDPSPAGIRQTWSSAAARKGGSNLSGYSNPVFDRLVDSAASSMDGTAYRTYYRRAYEIIIADAPGVWLYETVNFAAHDRRVQLAELRADAWWAGIGQWKIAPDGRLPRDGIQKGLAAN